jgi:hypothetical protein
MLRLTVTNRAEGTTLFLEGRLCGAWVDELAACWRRVLAKHDVGPIRVDLDGVTFVDAAGKALIRAMCDQGAILVATEVMMRTIVEEKDPDAARNGMEGRRQ